MSYLLDTQVVSEIRKSARANGAVMKWISDVKDEDLLVTRNTRDVARTGARFLNPFEVERTK